MNINYSDPAELLIYEDVKLLHLRAMNYRVFDDSYPPNIHEVYELYKIFGSLDLVVEILGFNRRVISHINFKFNFPPTSTRLRDTWYRTSRDEIKGIFEKQLKKAKKHYNEWKSNRHFSPIDEWEFFEEPPKLMSKLETVINKIETDNWINIIVWHNHHAVQVEFEDEVSYVWYLSLDYKQFFKLA